jgi:aarF domain-containing kinase
MEFDLAIMKFFINVGHFVDKDFNFRWLYDDASQNLRKETDFRLEAANIAKITALMKGYHKLIFPKVFAEYSSSGVLTMEFIEGYSITQVDRLKSDNIHLDKIARTMAESFAKMIFQLGFVHADPHPGNLFVQKDGKGGWQLVLLDNGLYAELSEVTRFNYSKMWVGIINRDEDMLKESTEKLGVGFAHRLFTAMVTKQSYESSIESKEGDLKKRLKGTNPAEEKRRVNAAHARRWRKQILECLEKVNRDMILLFKIHNYIESIDTKLGQPINNYWYTAKFAFQTYLKDTRMGWLQRVRVRVQMWTVFFWLLVYEWGLILQLNRQQ